MLGITKFEGPHGAKERESESEREVERGRERQRERKGEIERKRKREREKERDRGGGVGAEWVGESETERQRQRGAGGCCSPARDHARAAAFHHPSSGNATCDEGVFHSHRRLNQIYYARANVSY